MGIINFSFTYDETDISQARLKGKMGIIQWRKVFLDKRKKQSGMSYRKEEGINDYCVCLNSGAQNVVLGPKALASPGNLEM